MREQATNEVARQFTEQDGIGSIVEAIVAVLLFFLQIPQRQMQVEAVSGKLLDIGLGCEAGDETMPRRDGPRRLAQEAHIISGLEQDGGCKGDLYLSWPVFALHQARGDLLLREGNEPGREEAIMRIKSRSAKEWGEVGGLIGKGALPSTRQRELMLAAYLGRETMFCQPRTHASEECARTGSPWDAMERVHVAEQRGALGGIGQNDKGSWIRHEPKFAHWPHALNHGWDIKSRERLLGYWKADAALHACRQIIDIDSLGADEAGIVAIEHAHQPYLRTFCQREHRLHIGTASQDRHENFFLLRDEEDVGAGGSGWVGPSLPGCQFWADVPPSGTGANALLHCCQAASLVASILPMARAKRITTSTPASASVQAALESCGVQELSSVSARTNRQALPPTTVLIHNTKRGARRLWPPRPTICGAPRKATNRSMKRNKVASTKNIVMLASVML